jgi:hypothetical protein
LGNAPSRTKPTVTVSPVASGFGGRTTNSPLRFSTDGGGSAFVGSAGCPSTVQSREVRWFPTVRGISAIGSRWGLRITYVPRTSRERRSGKSFTSASTRSSAGEGAFSQVRLLRRQWALPASRAGLPS